MSAPDLVIPGVLPGAWTDFGVPSPRSARAARAARAACKFVLYFLFVPKFPEVTV